jgi:hypothetical protein
MRHEKDDHVCMSWIRTVSMYSPLGAAFLAAGRDILSIVLMRALAGFPHCR